MSISEKTESKTDDTENVNDPLESFINETIDEQSPPTQSVVDAPMENPSGGASESEETIYVDEPDDEIFDPNVHAVDSTGKPIIGKSGKYRKKRGRKPGSKNSSGETDPVVDASRQAGFMTAQAIMMLGIALFGDEWKPVNDPKRGINESVMLIDAWSKYYESTGTTDVPAWMLVVIATGAYTVPRLQKENTQSRMSKIKDWFMNLIKKR